MEDIPEDYCGICDVCGKPGHTRAHPRSPTTGAWCDDHWQALESYQVFTLGDVIQLVCLVALLGGGGFALWKLFF